ncbi:MAG: hypothetical protein KAQ95_01745, partial [Candidatus Heimdallarchaeota archaeon]|nr:hypothetical protein [Candidatus Heimdallarchaeota archaeon]
RFKLIIILFIFILNIIPVNCSTNDAIISFEKLSEINTGNAPFDVQLSSNLAFVSDYYGGLSVFDVTNASEPILIDNLPLSLAHYFHVAEKFAYVACWNYGLKIVNITDPTNLTEVGSYNDGVEVGGTFISNDVAIVTKTDGGVLLLNVSDPTDPQKISQYNATGIPNVCVIRENIAFVAYWEDTGSRIVFLNISEPITPVFIGQYNDTMDTYDFHLKDDLLIIANDASGVYFVNISNLANPIKITQIDTSSLAVGVDTIDNYAFIGDWNTLEVIDFSDFTDLRFIGSFDDTGAFQKLQIVNDLVYAVNNPKGLVIFRYTIEEVPTSSSILFIFPMLTSLVIITIILNFKRKK